MKSLYLFNPENDMALAYGGPYYMPPTNIRKMAHDLAALPLWYAQTDGCVWLPDVRQKKWMEECGFSFKAIGSLKLDSSCERVAPWGWSPSLIHRMREAGVREECCPSLERMERIRHLSSRATAVEILSKMDILGCLGVSEALYSIEEIITFMDKKCCYLLKAPWSGSGRGIQMVEGELTVPLQGWIKHILKTQGYVVGEPLYQKVVDFAMEFRAYQGRVSFVGYSFFETDARGIYKENLLASDKVIEECLSAYVSSQVLDQIKCFHEKALTCMIQDAYEGYLGVDMMICHTENGYAVHPCVEINLRMNMGTVSRLLYDQYVSSEVPGRFVIEYYSKHGDAVRMHQELQELHPLVMKGERINQGYLSLTPVFEDTSYQAYVLF